LRRDEGVQRYVVALEEMSERRWRKVGRESSLKGCIIQRYQAIEKRHDLKKVGDSILTEKRKLSSRKVA